MALLSEQLSATENTTLGTREGHSDSLAGASWDNEAVGLDVDENFFWNRNNTGLFQIPENVMSIFLQLLRGWSPGKRLDFVLPGEEPARITVVDSSRCWAAD